MDSENPGDHLGGEAMEVTAVYIKDTRHFHLFKLEDGQGVTGSLYFPKGAEAIPDQVVIILKTQGEEKKLDRGSG